MASDASTTTLSEETFKPLLRKLVSSPSSFTLQDFQLAFSHLTISPAQASASSSPTPHGHAAQIASFLTALRLTGKDTQADFVAAAAQAMRENAVQVDIGAEIDGQEEGVGKGERGMVCDIVGTGGDGHNTFNVSTASAIIAAGAGAIVCKHGNRASSSTSGSADVLVALGAPISTLQPSDLRLLSLVPSESVPYPFLFLYAPFYHPSFAAIGPIRRLLAHPTLFNTLGPLVNPARPQAMIIGVARKELGQVFAEALRTLGVKSAWVVNGEEGLDEISCAGNTFVWEVKGLSEIKHFTISPSSFGLPTHPLTLVSSPDSTASGNAALMNSLLTSQLPLDHPIETFVVLNAAALLYVVGVAKDYRDGVAKARESIKEGRAMRALDDFRKGAERIIQSARHKEDPVASTANKVKEGEVVEPSGNVMVA